MKPLERIHRLEGIRIDNRVEMVGASPEKMRVLIKHEDDIDKEIEELRRE